MPDVSERAEFSFVRYAQCWEDADILLNALRVKPGGQYISIASGGENSFSILSRGGKVTAVDLSLPQLAVTDLKRAAYLTMDYDAFLAFIGARASSDRLRQYRPLRGHLHPDHRAWLEMNRSSIENGVIHCGKFENYFTLFRQRVLPLIHGRNTIEALLRGNPDKARRRGFYEKRWNNLRYRMLFRIFFSRRVMGKHGRDAAFFNYVQGSVADRIRDRVKRGLIEVDGPENPYLHYILTGNYGEALPHALRRESFDAIKANIGGLTLVRAPLEKALEHFHSESVDGFNLSDIFEYMAYPQMNALYDRLLLAAAPGARLAYWNMLAPRQADPELFHGRITERYREAGELLKRDKAFFYSRFVIEEKV